MHKTRFIVVIMVLSVLVLAVSVSADSAVFGTWRDITPNAYISPPANPKLNSLYMLSATEGWAVGDSRPTTNTTIGLPAIFHYDGATWNLVPAPKFPDFPSSSSAYNLTSVSFGPPKSPISRMDGWAVGFNGTFPASPANRPPNATALHWDGITWRVQIAGLSGANAGPLWSVSMVSPTDVWAVGETRTGAGTFWHWTGSPGLGGGWNLVQLPIAGPPAVVFYSVFMVSATEGWAVGSGGAIYRYTAGTWTPYSSPVTTTLRSVYMLSPTDGWAVGDGGVILRFTTGIWTGPVSPGTTTNGLLSVAMASGTEGWAVGRAGTILHYSGASWTLLPPNLVPTSPVTAFSFNSVFTTTAADIWSVGTAGVILHNDGVTWGAVTSPTLSPFNSVSFGPPVTGPVNPNDGWAVGNVSFSEPTIYHWNGFMWTKGIAIGATNHLNSVFMLSTGDVWAVGGGANATASCSPPLCPIIMRYTGGSWNTITPPPGNYRLKSVFMVSSTEGWAVGQSVGNTGIILHYTVTGGVGTWGIFPAPATPMPIPSLNSIFMLGPNEGWAVGDNATILRYTVTGGVGTWSLVTVSGTPTLSRNANLTSIFMLTPTIGWIVGGIQLPAGAGPGAFAAGPVILYWDGTKWEPVATPTIPGGTAPSGITSATLKTIYCSGPNDCWTGGLPGKLVATLFHWDGIAWSHVTTSPALLGQNLPTASGGIVTPPILNSIYMTSPSNGWTVGSARTFETIPSGIPGGELSAILRFSPFGGLLTGTATTTVVSTVTTSTSLITTMIASTLTSLTTETATTTTTSSVSGGGIPGFPVESILAGIVFGLVTLTILRRRRARGHEG